MSTTHPAFPDFVLDKLSDTDPNQDAELFKRHTERKIIFARGDSPANNQQSVHFTFRKNVFFLAEVQVPSGIRTTERLPLHGTTSERVFSLYSRMHGIELATASATM